MEIFYILSIIILGIGFIVFKKSDEKLSIVKWIVMFFISLLAYNVTVCMLLGLINIKADLWLLALINIIVAVLINIKTFKNKDFQKYEFKKTDLIGILFITILCSVVIIKDMCPQDGGIKYAAIDSAIHFRAAKHYSENLNVFTNCEDKTIFDFNFMQTGAYINDGLLMRVGHPLTGIGEEYIYEAFEISIYVLNLFTFYVLVKDSIKGKIGTILSFILIGLYAYGYPYNSYMYGFSYLSVGVLSTLAIVIVIDMLYDKERKFKSSFVIPLLVMQGMLLIFSYCLFVPGIFAGICIYTFIKDFKDEGKSILKIFKKKTLIILGLLILVTAYGIMYLVYPTFVTAGQSNLKDALLNDGGMYKNLISNFIFYIPFGILFIVDIIKRRKEVFKEFKFTSIEFFTIFIGLYFIAMWIGMRLAIMSTYYFFKIYYIMWPLVLATTIVLVNRYSEKKLGKILFGVYIVAWTGYVIFMVAYKTYPGFSYDKKVNTRDYTGMYYDQNCNFRGLIQAYNNLAKEQIEIINAMKELNLKAEDITLISGSYYERCWATALGNLTSDTMIYQDVIQDTDPHTLEEGLNNPNSKYVIRVNESYDLDDYEKAGGDKTKYNVLIKNSRGYIIEKTN